MTGLVNCMLQQQLAEISMPEAVELFLLLQNQIENLIHSNVQLLGYSR